jgi:hypothetical protein
MKIRLYLGLSILALAGAFIMNGCKATATDPTYVALAEIRFADYHQRDPIKIYMYPQNATSSDSIAKTPTPLTYGIITPYFTNLPTNRDAGMTYHLIAVDALNTTVAKTDVTLKPGDRFTWLITGPGGSGGAYDQTLISDNPPANQPQNLAYYRFVNVSKGHTLDLRIEDPLSGFAVASGVQYGTFSPYVGIDTAKFKSVTFYVVENGTVLGRLTGIDLVPGSYHTVTWGGQDTSGGGQFRSVDPITGLHTLNDTTRIRIWNDDPNQGVDQTYAVPQAIRFNIINALLPPTNPTASFIDYTQSGGLAIIINNNTDYDFNGLMPFSLAPPAVSTTNGVPNQIPMSMPFTPGTDKLYIQFVKPNGTKPSPADKILFRFYAGPTGLGSMPFISDQLYTIVVYDTVRKNPPVSTQAQGYDSNFVATIPIPDVPRAGMAHILVGKMLANPVKPLTVSLENKGLIFTVSDGITTQTASKITKTKDVDTSIWVSAGSTVTLSAQISTDPLYTSPSFVAEDGAIYEAFLVGGRGRSDGDKYGPRWMIVRINPQQ